MIGSSFLRRLPLLAAAALAACTTVGPDYHLPETAALRRPAAGTAFAQAIAPAADAAPLPDGWWRLYRSAELDALVEEALAANTSLRVATAHLRRAAALVAAGDAEHLPHGGVKGGLKRARESGEAFLLPEQLPVMNEGELVVGASYQLDLWGQLRRGEEAAEANLQAVEAARDLARISVVSQVAQAYLQVCHARAQRSAATDALALRERSLALAERLEAEGRAARADVLQAQGLVETQRAALSRFDAEREAGLYRLAYLLGHTPQELAPQQVACAAPPVLAQAIPAGDGAALLKRRPDVRQAERELAVATARIGVATAELYPSISFGASLGALGLAGHLGEPATQAFGLGPLLSWRIPDAGSRARVRMAEADQQAALARFDGVVLQALAEVESALSRYRRDLERLSALRQARDKAAALAQDQQHYVEAGRRPLATALESRQMLAVADIALAAEAAEIARDQVQVFLALGGGWESSGTAQAPDAQPR